MQLEIASLHNNIGNLHSCKGENDLALDYYKKCLGICIYINGGNHPQTAITYRNTGAVYLSKGEYKEANKLFEKGSLEWIKDAKEDNNSVI